MEQNQYKQTATYYYKKIKCVTPSIYVAVTMGTATETKS